MAAEAPTTATITRVVVTPLAAFIDGGSKTSNPLAAIPPLVLGVRKPNSFPTAVVDITPFLINPSIYRPDDIAVFSQNPISTPTFITGLRGVSHPKKIAHRVMGLLDPHFFSPGV